jgi:serine/threonine-protein kinase RsbW
MPLGWSFRSVTSRGVSMQSRCEGRLQAERGDFNEVQRRAVSEKTADRLAAPPVAAGDHAPKDVVTVRMPAEGAYLSVLRTATAGLAARLDFTLDEIEDLRIAVDEACAMLLPQASPGADLECGFELDTRAMTVTVSVLAENGRPPSRDTFAWTVLTALAGKVDAQVGPDKKVTIILQKSRDTSRDG